MAKRYKVHPAIGFARVGTSPEFFLGPERVGTHAQPADGRFRDAQKRLRRQAARFWVFEYDDAAPDAAPRAVSVGAQGVSRIEWSVHLSNRKAVWFKFAGITGEGPAGYPPNHPLRNDSITDPAERRRRLVIEPRPRSIVADGTVRQAEVSRGTSADPAGETWPPTLTGGARIDSLGSLAVDAEGRLTVAGGFGTSGTTGALPPDGRLAYDNNDGWFDDVSDGPVTARVVFDDGSAAEASTAWAIAGPPDYAPSLQNIVTVYDLLYDLALRHFRLDPAIFDAGAGGFQSSFRPSFTKDVYPMIRRALDYQWVIEEAEAHANSSRFDIDRLAAPPAPGETPASNPRDRIVRRLRDPDDVFPGQQSRNMPKLHNDGIDGAPPETLRFTVTRFQFFVMKQWAAGAFAADWNGAPEPPEVEVSAAGLDRAAGEAACGGSFFPGMEAGWILRDPRVYLDPFEYRFRHVPGGGTTGLASGDASKRMAIPWQADFLKCAQNWWPAQRPNQVRLAGGGVDEWDRGIGNHVQLVGDWSKLGVVAADPNDPAYVQSERELP